MKMTLPKILEKKKLLLFVLISLSFLFVPSVKAMVVLPGDGGRIFPGGGESYQFDVWEPAVYQAETEMNQQSFTNETIRATAASISDKIMGCVNCDPKYQGQGAVQSLGNLIAGMYANPPASSVEYFADLGQNLGIAKPAYAQGFGFERLGPILPIWRAFRNIAYLFFVVIFVIIGFAIMFRVKINPQTVISIQNALPRIVIALILVTFSYAIAGLLIDLMYVAIFLIVALFKSQGLITKDVYIRSQIIGEGNIFQLVWSLWGALAGGASEAVKEMLKGLTGSISVVSSLAGFLAKGIAYLVFAIAIAFALFKLFFLLLMSYISIIVGTIFGPIVILLDALPGQRGFSSWIKMLLSNIIVFPVTATAIMVGAALVGATDWGVPSGVGYQAGTQGWVAPMLGGGFGAEQVKALVALGIILLLPQIVEMVKKTVGAPGIAGMAAGIGGAIGAGVGVVTAPARTILGPTAETYRKYAGERTLGAIPGIGRLVPPESQARWVRRREG